MRTNQSSLKRSTQPVVTVDQAREMVWLRAAFSEGFAAARDLFLEGCDIDTAAALMCTLHLGCADAVSTKDHDWLLLLFSEDIILNAQHQRKEGDRFHRLMYLFGQVDQDALTHFDIDHEQAGPEDVFGVEDAGEIKNFVMALYKKTVSYRDHRVTQVRHMMLNKTLGSNIRLV